MFSSSTEQHVDARPSRQMRDDAVCKKLMQWFSEHPAFPLLDKIVSLSTGVVGGSTINCFEATKIGFQLLQDSKVQWWLGYKKKAESCGCQQGLHELTPVSTSLEAASQELLKLVSYGCPTGCGRACGCRKAGLKCSEMCTYCNGLFCTNARATLNAGSDSEDEDDSLQYALSQGETEGAAEQSYSSLDDGCNWTAKIQPTT
ncbi:hypothetical protein JTB14_037008 [Gonioctena quinquepunctata]|nr:hypothetical protein JTB14_037008 [Gonioctena quinquepunctata]